MRQITKDAVHAFYHGHPWHRDNTQVVVTTRPDGAKMYLHGNLIAKRGGGALYLTDAGWKTVTTKERLNGILAHYGAGIHQKHGEWFLTRPATAVATRTDPWDALADDDGWVKVGG